MLGRAGAGKDTGASSGSWGRIGAMGGEQRISVISRSGESGRVGCPHLPPLAHFNHTTPSRNLATPEIPSDFTEWYSEWSKVLPLRLAPRSLRGWRAWEW